MSAITGIFRRNGRNVDPTEIKKMNDKLSHRGPDGSKIWCEGPIAFGHQMLHTTPESLYETLPFEDKESGLVITADARIDNRKDLATKLGIEDNEYVSDSYFILKAYEKWGEKCPDELLGDFAFAIWDGNNLFCSKDHMGVKQLYYFADDDIFLFSTEIKALFEIEEVTYDLNERKVALYLMKDTCDNELTFYNNIKNLPASYFLKIGKNDIKKNRYWKLDPNLQIIMGSEEEYARAFLQIFGEAIQCRLRSAYSLGFDLSGGLDSSSIICTVKTLLNQNAILDNNINSFSRIFDETPESDEQYYINKVISIGGIKPHFISGDNVSPLENIEDILFQLDQPFYSPHMTKHIKSYKKMHELGVRIVFSGQGGDQNISLGRNYLRELLITFQWRKFVRELKYFSHNVHRPVYDTLIEKVIFPSLPYALKKGISRLFGRKLDLLNQNFLKSLHIDEEYYNILADDLNKISSKEYHYYSITYAVPEITFSTIDRSVAFFNIDYRYPFYDKRLVEFCYALPSEMKFKNGWNRYILRLAMENILPKEIQWRAHKSDLSYSYKKNLLLEIKKLEKIIYEDNEIIEKFVNLKTIQKIFEKYKSEGNNNIFDFWIVILLYYWLKYTYKCNHINCSFLNQKKV